MTVSDLTEAELIARIRSRLPTPPPWVSIGIGDDAAVIEPVRNRLEVITVDALVEGVHFDRAFTPPRAIGHRALAVNLSDLAAMGAEPRLALLSLALPSALLCADFDAMIDGLADLAARHRVHVIGGNLTRSPGPLILDVTVAGSIKRRQVLTRSGARPGDFLYVTGTIGGSAAGLEMLRSAGNLEASLNHRQTTLEAPSDLRRSSVEAGSERPRSMLEAASERGRSALEGGSKGGQTAVEGGSKGGQTAVEGGSKRGQTAVEAASDDGRSGLEAQSEQGRSSAAQEQGRSSAVQRYLYPEPRVRAGLMLSRNRAATACIDLSDGLADGVRQIAAASGVGIVIDAGALPIDQETREWFTTRGADPISAALAADDYELLFTVRPQIARRLHSAMQHAAVSITRIGRCTDETAVSLERGSITQPIPHGYKHFA